MSSFFEIIEGLLDFLGITGMSNHGEHDRRPENSKAFKFVLFIISVITFVGFIGQLNLNPELLSDIGWWSLLTPLGWLFAFLFIRFFYAINHLVNLAVPLLIYLGVLFPLTTLVFIGIWFV